MMCTVMAIPTISDDFRCPFTRRRLQIISRVGESWDEEAETGRRRLQCRVLTLLFHFHGIEIRRIFV